ncbi:F-box domain protein [Aspergillus clavatus NRRL 1]|uniref:F-box domain protein n=1 Tax=Aspergillus clavatus (strain ATCC 1007 / CBS 513.65 / DSM 816 / NCTC 3887 / NRRL 1 / QM 1276 / 107) TaxID=344612 RepID=A1CEW1_ASPCL|nr:F-box domain protein [Aspergillus clavatus NRRL 1]EAW11410.1 F-box domain protein [Aspergillus clavatus NRRL 1]
MEQDVRTPSVERLGGSFLSSDSIQEEHSVCMESQKEIQKQNLPSFSRLPRSVIENILYLVDANSFASLALLNRKWRRISESTAFYAYHLSRCPSFTAVRESITSETNPENLASLKRRFLSEARRSTFEVFLKPRRKLIKLISSSMSSSTAFPQGEAFRFAFSPNAQMVLCISSSRILVLDVTTDCPSVKHELKIWRRPLNATILDDGSLLAVVSSDHQVNIYSLTSEEAHLIQDLKLNEVPRALALSPNGGVLAIAYNDKIEMYAVGEGALATERRAVRCDGVDAISFSSDGVMLIGSSANCDSSNLVTISVPFYTDPETEASPREVQVRMWTTQILFPDLFPGYSHACLLPLHTEGEGSWVLGFDRRIRAFRAFGVTNANSGTTYFVGPISESTLHESLPMMVPSADCQGELVALGFQGSGLWVYGVPHRLDIASAIEHTQDLPDVAQDRRTRNLGTLPHDNSLRLEWAVEKPRTLVSGHKISDMSGLSAARWVRDSPSKLGRRRLVAVAPGGISPPTIGDEDVPVDGGRVLLLDFERSPTDGQVTEINIEIGEAEPKLLHEPNSSLDSEVELERRRTLLHHRAAASQMRAAPRDVHPAARLDNHQTPSFDSRRHTSFFSGSSNDIADNGIPPLPDTPYDNTQPRSQDTLRRAATAASSSRGRYNPLYRDRWSRIQNERQTPQVPQLFQVPHESDADNWVPPPPPYSREPDAPLPEYLRRTLLPRRTEAAVRAGATVLPVRRSQTTRWDNASQEGLSRSPQRMNSVAGSLWDSQEEYDQDGILRGRDHTARHLHDSRVRHFDPQRIDSGPAQQFLSVNPPMTTLQMNEQSFMDNQWHAGGYAAQPTPLGTSHYPLSISSPNLQVPVPENSAAPVVQPNSRLNSIHRSTTRRSQSHDFRLPPTGIPHLNRRVSTDPTLSMTSANELWRRRIEEWNEQTIYERNKRRTRCIVM